MLNFTTGVLVLIAAVLTGLSVAQGKYFLAVIYFVVTIFLYNKLERNTLD